MDHYSLLASLRNGIRSFMFLTKADKMPHAYRSRERLVQAALLLLLQKLFTYRSVRRPTDHSLLLTLSGLTRLDHLLSQ